MLPTYPKIVAVRAETNTRVIKAMVGGLSPMIGMIAHNVQFEGQAHRMARHDETVDESPLIQVGAEISIPRDTPLTAFTEERLLEHLAAAAKQFAQGQTEAFCAEIDRVTRKVGNVVDAGGQPMTEDLLLATLAKMEHSFDERGNWQPPTLFGGTAALEAFAGGKGSPEFNSKLGEILEKKRDDFRRREADRVLAG